MSRAGALGAAAIAVAAAALTVSVVLAGGARADVASELALNRARLVMNPILADLQALLPSIGRWDEGSERVADSIEALGGTLVAVDLGGRVLFDSRDAGAFARGQTIDLASSLHYDRAWSRERPGQIRIAFPLLAADRQVGNAIVDLPASLVSEAGVDPRIRVALPAMIGLVALGLLAIAQMLQLRRRLLAPVGELAAAARRLAAGDLETPTPGARSTDVRALAAALDELREGLVHAAAGRQAADLARRELTAQISHDLRTPLASIRAYVEGIQDGVAGDPQTVERYLAVIRQKAESLAALVEDLFQQSLADIDRLPVAPEERYSAPMLAAILEPIAVQLRSGPIAFVVEEPLANVLVRADPRRIEQVVVNLVANARRNTPEGGRITVGATVRGDCLAVRVADTGRGIPEEELPFIFDRFYRGKAESRDSGSGLGLAICRSIVERHGGTIIAESGPAPGAVFTFTLPKA